MYFWRYCIFLVLLLTGTGFYFLPERFVVNTPLIEGWVVLNDAWESVLRADLQELKSVSSNLDAIKNAGGYRNWMKSRKPSSINLVSVDASNYGSFLSGVANAVTRSGNTNQCTVVSISVARKLSGKPILDDRFFLESFVGERGRNGLNVLENFLNKAPRINSRKTPFINPFPHRGGVSSLYPSGANNLRFVSSVINNAPNNSSFIFACYKGGLEDGMRATGGHAFNVIKDQNGLIKFFDGQLKDHLEYGVGFEQLLLKMNKHGDKLPDSSWHIFDASTL